MPTGGYTRTSNQRFSEGRFLSLDTAEKEGATEMVGCERPMKMGRFRDGEEKTESRGEEKAGGKHEIWLG